MRRLVSHRWACLALVAIAVVVLLPAAALIAQTPLLLQPTQVAIRPTPTSAAVPTLTHVPLPPTVAPKDLSLHLTSLWSGIRFSSFGDWMPFEGRVI